MKANIEITPEIRRCWGQIFKKQERIKELRKEESDIHDDMTISKNLLTLLLRDAYERKGFVEGAEVRYENKKYKISMMYFDDEALTMVAILNPSPKLKLFGKILVDNLTVVKKVKKAKNGNRKRNKA